MDDLKAQLDAEIEAKRNALDAEIEAKKTSPTSADAQLKAEIESKKAQLTNPIYKGLNAANLSKEQTEEPTTEKEPEKPTTAAGLGGAVVRGVAPTLAEAGGGAIIGGAFGSVIPGAGTIAGAKFGAQSAPLLGQLSDLTINTVNSAFGTHYTSPKEATTHFLDKIGVPKPESSAEKIVQAISEGAAEMGTGGAGLKALGQALPAGKIQKVAQFLGEKPVEQAVAGGASKGTSEYIKESGGGPWEQFAGELGAGVLSPAALKSLEIPARAGIKTFQALKDLDLSKIGQGIKTAFSATETPRLVEPTDINKTIVAAAKGDVEAKRRLASSAASMTPETKQAIEATGLEIPAELTSASPEFKKAAQVAASAPGSQIASEQSKAINLLSEKAKEVTEKLGATSDLSTLSKDVRDSFDNTIKSYKSTEKQVYDEIYKNVPKSTEADVSKSTAAVKQVIQDLGGKTKSLNSIERDILNELSGTPTLEGLIRLKQKVGERLSNELYKDVNSKLAGDYYNLLREDVINTLKKKGQDQAAIDIYKVTTERKGLEEQASKLFGKQIGDQMSGSIEGEIGKLPKETSDKIKSMFDNVPKEFKQDVASSAILNAITKEGEFNVRNFVKWYGNFKTQKEAYNALFDNIPDAAKTEMDNLYAISKNIDESLRSTERTGRLSQAALIDAHKKNETLASNILHIAKSGAVGAAVGIPLKVVSSALGVPVGFAGEIASAVTGAVAGKSAATPKIAALQSANDLLTSPEFAKLVKASVGNPTEFSKAYTLLEKTPYYKRFVKETGLTAAQRASLFAQEAVAPQSQGDQIEAGLSAAESETK